MARKTSADKTSRKAKRKAPARTVPLKRPSAVRTATRDDSHHPVVVPLSRLRPTQGAVGMRAVAARREKIERVAGKTKKIAAFLETRPIPAVAGPGGALFIIDRHHLTLALMQSRVSGALVEVIDDLSSHSMPRFWRTMIETGRAHPFNEYGQPIALHLMPQSVAALAHDPFRDLAWSARELGAFTKDMGPFAEFQWAAFFRAHISERFVLQNYDLAVDVALRLARTADARHLPGYRARPRAMAA